VLVGTIASDPAAAPLLATSPIIRALHELWRDKADDAEVTTRSRGDHSTPAARSSRDGGDMRRR